MAFPIGADAVRSVRERTPTTADHFDAIAYRDKLIAGGIDPTSASEVAAKTAAARTTTVARLAKLGSLANNLFEQATQFEAPAQTVAEEVVTVPLVCPLERNLVLTKAARTKRDEKLLDFAVTIANKPPGSDDMAFSHAILCQVGLPRSEVTEREFMRRSGDAWLSVQAGFMDEGNGPVAQPVPYGVMPRLALAWVSTFAKRHKTREVPIGDNPAQFLRLLGLDTQGARYKTLRTHMHALAVCRLQLGFKGRTFNGQVVEQFDTWLSDQDSKQRTVWPGVMVLSEGYFKELIDSGVPLDNRALLALSGSSLALDIYAWLAHRLYRIGGRPVIIYWKNLCNQFGQEYKGEDADKNFKKKFLPQLRKVLAVYPKAHVKQVTGGIMLMSSPPPISQRPKPPPRGNL